MNGGIINRETISGGVIEKKRTLVGGVVEPTKQIEGGAISRNQGGTNDYERLRNLPQKDNVTIIGNQTNEELHIAAIKTSEQWAQLTELVSVRGEAYVFSDAGEDEDGNPIPKIKYGDGLAYVVDLPFAAATDLRITDEDIKNWNNKVAIRVDGEILVFY